MRDFIRASILDVALRPATAAATRRAPPGASGADAAGQAPASMGFIALVAIANAVIGLVIGLLLGLHVWG